MVDQNHPVVQTAGLCKTFKDFWRRPRVEAVKDLSLQIHAGEVFGLLGPNGSGKTTTIKMLLGLLYPTRGRISVFGQPPSDVLVKSRIGFLPEESYLYRFLVAHETLDYYGKLFRIPTKIRKDRIDRLLDMVGLRHEAKRPVGEYSKGMARRLGLAQALINDPEFLILDEPTSGLDPIGARQIKDVIQNLGKKGKTILLSSHMLADVEDVCDRVTILYGGQQRAVGDIDELLRERNVTQITVPQLNEGTIRQVRDVIQRLEKKDIMEVSNPRVKLEDFFLRIVEEAQAANIQTSGARQGGKMPDFLQAPAVTESQTIVESLVSASEIRTEPRAETIEPTLLKSTAAIQKPEPDHQVLDDLLSTNKKDTPQEIPATQETATDTPASHEDTPRQAPLADQSVIDGLLDSQLDPDSSQSDSTS